MDSHQCPMPEPVIPLRAQNEKRNPPVAHSLGLR